jgi:hypothetical protein
MDPCSDRYCHHTDHIETPGNDLTLLTEECIGPGMQEKKGYTYSSRPIINTHLVQHGVRMDILSKINISIDNRTRHFSAVLQTARGIVRWLIEFFTVTEEDQIAAGSCSDYDERVR